MKLENYLQLSYNSCIQTSQKNAFKCNANCAFIKLFYDDIFSTNLQQTAKELLFTLIIFSKCSGVVNFF